MIKDIFPLSLSEIILSRFNIAGIYEFRIRVDKPIYINYYGEYIPVRNSSQSIIFADQKLIEYIISHVTEMSVYRYNLQIKQGFITTQKGIRIGLAGEVVQSEDGEIKTVKNLSGIVIRIPHEIKNCASEIMPYIVDCNEVKNTLIISPPGCGKTTFLRDISRQLSYQERMYNILIVDERYEIAGAENGIPRMDVGLTTDVISGGNKTFAFNNGIRSLKPDVILTDEIGSKPDAIAIKQAMHSGVKVIATAHAGTVLELKKRAAFTELFKDKVFERIIVLSTKRGMGTVDAILNADLDQIK